MHKLTGIIIAKNEEEMIGESLDSLSFCDELIVIDNGSIDKTKDIARQKNAHVYELEADDFSQLRNFGLSKALGQWVLYLDADERINDDLKASILKVLENESKINCFKLKRKNYYFGKNEWPRIEKMQRLFRRSALKGWYGKLHESPKVEGTEGELDGFILHFTHRNLESMLSKTIEWSTMEAILRFNSGHPKMTWWRFPRVMLTAFVDSYIKQQGFKAGAVGVIESLYQSFSMFITYAKLWELQNKK